MVAGRSGYPEFEGLAMEINGAVLFCDASGFTALTEKLAQRPGGAERLRNIINKFFTILIDVVLNNGGDVIKFAGDAVLIVFPVHEGAGECPIDYSPDLKTAVMRAVQCQATVRCLGHPVPYCAGFPVIASANAATHIHQCVFHRSILVPLDSCFGFYFHY